MPDEINPRQVTDAAVSLRTWHGWDGHHKPLSVNDHQLPIGGNHHHHDMDRLEVPVAALRPGENVFRVESDTHRHMLEVLWPGPSLLLRLDSTTDARQ